MTEIFLIFVLTELCSVGKKSPVKALADFLPVAREVVGPPQEAGLSPGVEDRVARLGATQFTLLFLPLYPGLNTIIT